jgi:hypothetical protein
MVCRIEKVEKLVDEFLKTHKVKLGVFCRKHKLNAKEQRYFQEVVFLKAFKNVEVMKVGKVYSIA